MAVACSISLLCYDVLSLDYGLDELLQERDLMTKLLKVHLERVRQHMKKQDDKDQTERVFQMGDWVYLKLQPCMQSSVERRANHELSFQFY
jgi:hypothetical protein